jgi:hypothetical protein
MTGWQGQVAALGRTYRRPSIGGGRCFNGCPRVGQIRFHGHVDRIADIVVSAQIVEGHDMRCLGCKRAGQDTLKSIIRRIVRPERENTSWIKMTSKPSQPFRLVQRGVAWMQQLARRMIDIDQHGIETPAR